MSPCSKELSAGASVFDRHISPYGILLDGVRGLACFHNPQRYVSRRFRKEMFHLTTHSTHFVYGYMASDIW